ncbi:MAG: hypothetical protein LUE11_12920 [Clostridia bacterium]|nr:hypothetical protein [Clostridia bacterium]
MIKHFYVGSIPDGDITNLPSGITDLMNFQQYGVSSISGLTRPKAEVNRSALAGANASRISGAQITERNIVLNVDPRAGEASRQALYDVLPFDTMLRFYVITERRKVFIDGYVETIEGDDIAGSIFGVQISILCPFPWFQSIQLRKAKLTVGDNIICYDGDVPAGFTLDVPYQIIPPLIGSVSDLSVTVGGKTFAYSGRVSVPHICTIPGKKQFYGMRSTISGGVGNTVASAFGAIVSGCQWPMINRNNKIVTVSCLDTDVEWFEQQNVFTYRDTYSGV